MKAITEADGLQKEWMAQAKTQTLETLPEFLRKLTSDYQHDYGTICHAIAAAAVGAATAVNKSPAGGITGFQAGAVMWEIVEGWGALSPGPKRMQNFEDLLYPQMAYKFRTVPKSILGWLKEQAQKRIAEWQATGFEHVSERVRAHMAKVAKGHIPFGLSIQEDE